MSVAVVLALLVLAVPVKLGITTKGGGRSSIAVLGWKHVVKTRAANHLSSWEVVRVISSRNDLDNSHDNGGVGQLTRSERLAETARLFGELAGLSPEQAARADAIQDRLVRINMEVARDVAHRYDNRGIPTEDLQQVAYLGLVKAVQRFDSRRGTDFLGYAVPTVRGEVRRWFRDAGWMVRPPRSIQELQSRITRARADLSHRFGRPPELHEVAEHLGEDEAAVSRAMAANGCFSPTSLDCSDSADDEAAALADRVGDEEAGYQWVEAHTTLAPVLRELDEREQLMLRMRFVQGATQHEIGTELGVTQTQVSRLMSALLARLRDRVGDLAGAA